MTAEIKGRATECLIASSKIRHLAEQLDLIVGGREDGVLSISAFTAAVTGLCAVLEEMSRHLEFELTELRKVIEKEAGRGNDAKRDIQ